MLIKRRSRSPATCEFNGFRAFSPIEWLVIAIGGQSTSVPLSATRFGRELLAMVGAGEGCKLETLRRTAEIARRWGWGIPTAEVGLFHEAGWSERQFEALVEGVLNCVSSATDHRGERQEPGPAFELPCLIWKVGFREIRT